MIPKTKIMNYEDKKLIHSKDLLSTTDVSNAIGVNLTKTFITTQLEVYPTIQTTLGYYWPKDRLPLIRIALAKYVLEDVLEGYNDAIR
jgi:hypothetical protein